LQATGEKKIGLVPKLIVLGTMGPKEYALLVTDHRSILVLEKESKAGIAGALGGAAGALIAQGLAKERSFDYNQADVQSLALDSKNLTIPHEAIQVLQLKKALIGPIFRFELKYRNAEGKDKKLKGQLAPPGAHVKQRKQEGRSKKQIYYDYAKSVQDLYRSALSPVRFESVMASRL